MSQITIIQLIELRRIISHSSFEHSLPKGSNMSKFFFLLLGFACTATGDFRKEKIVNFEVNGEFYWEPFLDIDNSNNAGNIMREVSVKGDVFISYDNMVKTLMSGPMSGKLFDIIHIGVAGELNLGVKAEYEKMAKTRRTFKGSTPNKTLSLEVGPHSKVKLYRLAFVAPGMSFNTSTLTSNPVERTPVPITFTVRQIYVLEDIEVVYTDYWSEHPSNMIAEAKGYDPDINDGFKGKYVFLVAIWSINVDEGATGIRIAYQNSSDSIHHDLAGGVSKAFRYIDILKDPKSRLRITEIALWRSWSEEDIPTSNGSYQFVSGDINKDRKGSWLRLAWNTTLAP